MNQIKNLWLNVLWNIIIFVGVYKAVNFFIYDSIPTKELLNYIPAMGLTVLILLAMCLLNFITTAFGYPREFNNSKLYLVAPLNSVFLLFILLNFLTGNIKVFRTMEYAYIGRYYNKKIYFYLFTPYNFCRMTSGDYRGTEYDVKNIKKRLEEHHADLMEEQQSPKDTFRKWDGALDDQTKRIKTIKQITQ